MIARNRSVGQDRLGRSRSLTIARYILTDATERSPCYYLDARSASGSTCLWLWKRCWTRVILPRRYLVPEKKYIPAYKLMGTY